MRSLLLLSASALLLAGGCRAIPEQLPTETAPEAAEAPPQTAPDGPSYDEGSLCGAYMRQLAAVREAAALAPDDGSHRESIETYEAVIADACI